MDEDFEALLNEHLPQAGPKAKGDLVDANVVGILDDDVLVSYGSKEESAIPAEEFRDPKGELTVKVGDTVRVLLQGWDEDGVPVLSHKKARGAAAAVMLEEAAKAQVPVRGIVSRVVNGGVLVDVGMPAFLPASHIDLFRVGDLNTLVGQEIEAYVMDYNPQEKRAVLSRRKLLAERRDKDLQKFMDGVLPGSTVRGKVKQVLDFGVFVELGAAEGMIPRSELTYDRGVNPADIVTVGQEIEAKVLEVSRDTGKITLSRKRLHEDPWLTISEHFPVGATVTGKVITIQEFGAFVQLTEGITGLIHSKDISWESGKKSAKDQFREGDSVTCQIVDLDVEKKRLGLSLKHLARDPWLDLEAKYPVGSRHTGTVSGLRDFGAFVKLDEFTEALLHIGDLSWEKRPEHPSAILKEGQEVEVVILNLDATKRRISVGMKQKSASPFEQFLAAHSIGSLVTGKVSRMVPFGAFLELAPGLEGLIHISELDDHRVDAPEKVVRMGEEVTVKILEADSAKRKISLSRKDAFRELERENIRQYTKTENQKSVGLNFGAALKDAFNKSKPGTK